MPGLVTSQLAVQTACFWAAAKAARRAKHGYLVHPQVLETLAMICRVRPSDNLTCAAAGLLVTLGWTPEPDPETGAAA